MGLRQIHQQGQRLWGLPSVVQALGQGQAGAHVVRRQVQGALQQGLRWWPLLGAVQSLGLFAQVVGLAGLKAAFARLGQFVGHGGGLAPVARALVNAQQSQVRHGFKGRAFQQAQRLFGAVQQTGFQVVEGQGVLRPVAVSLAQVGAGQQVLVHPHRALVLAPAAKQIAQGKVQLRGVGVALHGFNEGVNRLVLLLVEQMVQAFEIGLGGALVVELELAQVKA